MPAIWCWDVGATPVAVLQGRAQLYERGRADEMKGPIAPWRRWLRDRVLTKRRAAPARHAAGSPMVISDHINFTGAIRCSARRRQQPLRRMVDAYDPSWSRRCCRWRAPPTSLPRRRLHPGSAARASNAGEIRARTLGGRCGRHVDGAETILARQAGMKVVAGGLAHDQLRGGSRTTSSATSRPWPWHATRRARLQRLLRAFSGDYR